MPIEVVVKTLFIILVVVGALAPVITWVERKQSALMQDRIGANRADIGGVTLLGLLHPAADVLKLLSKEDVVPFGANRFMHLISPLIAAVPAIIGYAVIPFGGVYHFGDTRISLVATYAYVTPVGAVLLGSLLLDEPLTVSTLVAGGMIVLAVALIVSSGGASATEEPIPPEIT